jgi:hypothetical protein
MGFIERKTIYFDKQGEKNTQKVLQQVKEYAELYRINDVVIASSTGETGAQASKFLKKFNLVVVAQLIGYRGPGMCELRKDYRKEILKNGAKILEATQALSGVARAVRMKFGTMQATEFISFGLRLMGEGTKVAVEVAVMAADAGLIPADKDVIAIAGTYKGVDTALLVKPANTSRFFDLQIKEIIAKPRNFKWIST